MKKLLSVLVAVALTVLIAMTMVTTVNNYKHYSDEEIMSEFIDHAYGDQYYGELIFTKNGSNFMAIEVFDENGTMIDSRFVNKAETIETYFE